MLSYRITEISLSVQQLLLLYWTLACVEELYVDNFVGSMDLIVVDVLKHTI